MATAIERGLTPEQLSTFHQNGFLVVPNFLSRDEVDQLVATTNELLDSFDLQSHPLTRFTTGDDMEASGERHVGDEYFLSSGDKIRFFLEPEAVATEQTSCDQNRPDNSENGRMNPSKKLLRPKHHSINKIGHGLHLHSASFSRVTLSPRNAAIAASLGFSNPRCLQSMVICKPPAIGGAVPPHRDSEFLYTNPPSAVGWWIALQDAGAGNAALAMAPGSHRRASGRICRRFVRANPGETGMETGTAFVANDGPGWASDALDYRQQQQQQQQQEEEGEEDIFEIVNANAGDLVLIHGNVVHASEKNTSNRSRFAYAFHVIESADGWAYDDRNWLQPPPEGFSRLNDVAAS
jgi:phytanoyl-CoA hydroxylase